MKNTKKILFYSIIALVCAALLCTALILLSKILPDKLPDIKMPDLSAMIPSLPTIQPEENVFTPLDFGYEGDYLTCLSAPSIRGIDVSTHQKKINFKKVKEAGFEFVMIRLGYRGSIQGVLFEDEWAQKNYKAAKAAGLKVGGYFFSQSISPEEAKEEAEYCMQIIQDWDVQMPIVYDWEFIQEGYRTDVVTARKLTDCTIAFCDTIEEAGYDSMVYFNPNQSRKKMHLEELTDYGFWLAMYSDEMTYEYKVDMWQYTNKGKVPGVKGNVDINLYFPYEEESS